ncbi:MAG: LegC family aminotransferase [bacterium]|nr:LegC family aminotransferase [bacterium]
MSKAAKDISLSIPYLNGNEWKYVRECLDTGWVSSVGKFVDKFEQAVGAYTGAKNAIACVNGTSGLQVALRLCGVGPGDEVIVPTLTFIAPVNAVRYLYADPVFMDCDDYMNLDAVKLREFCGRECVMTRSGLKNKKSGKIIKAVVPVHIFGNPCDMALIMAIAKKYRLKVVEDATESLGSYFLHGRYRKRHTGTIGDFGVYSFNGNKIITTGGGGMIVTSSAKLAAKAKYLTTQAKDDGVRYVHNEIGYNFRLTNLQAALGLAQLEQLPGFIKTKKDNYKLYKELLAEVSGVEILGVPVGTIPNYWFYSLRVDKRVFGMDKDVLMERLRAKGIQTRPIWQLNHRQRPYSRNQSYIIENAPRYWQQVLNLPCSTNLKAAQVEYIASVIKNLGGKN